MPNYISDKVKNICIKIRFKFTITYIVN